MATTTLNSSASKNRLYLLILISLFIAPMLLAWILIGRWQPSASVQHGELLNPVQPVPHFQAKLFSGKELDINFLKKHWTLAYINVATLCSDICRIRLYDMRQIRLALGKDMGRVQNILLQTKTPDEELVTWLLEQHPAMVKAVSDATTLNFFQKVFKTTDTHEPWIYLIDPLGNLVMRYDAGMNSKGILEDLKRLLKYSKIG
jgi:cytochrome oxidase Cu insertion factor (SCO1/SenC/PrrC family)